MIKIGKKGREVIRSYFKSVKQRLLFYVYRRRIPLVIIPALEYLVFGETKREVKKNANKIEKVRKKIADYDEESIEILYSPQPGSSDYQSKQESRPAPGQKMEFSMEQVANTGKDRRWGIVLHLLARSACCETILELGACAGISGSYLASSPHCQRFITVEGSAALAELAKDTIDRFADRAEVYNLLFDDALDKVLPELDSIDFAFIDGHHEKRATIHYWKRIKPNLADSAVVIFDDISWSYDMREAWNYLSRKGGFSHAMDLGVVGVCLWRGEETETTYWNLQPVVGGKEIGDPHGWD